MKRALAILLLLITLSLWGGAGRAADGEARELVAPASIAGGERLMLYSYTLLGVEVRSFTDEEFAEFQSKLAPVPEGKTRTMAHGKPAFLDRKTGLLVTRVLPGSPAEEGNIQEGDVIITIGGAPMEKPKDLLSVMRNVPPGSPMHMLLINGKDLQWNIASPRAQGRPEPAVVGHITPRKLCDKCRRKVQQHQARAIELLASNPVPIVDACNELESICRILYKGYTPGCLRIPLREGACTITATRNGWNIDVIMTENGVETLGAVKRWVVPEPQPAPIERGPDVLPEVIRQRLLEMDTSAASGVPTRKPLKPADNEPKIP